MNALATSSINNGIANGSPAAVATVNNGIVIAFTVNPLL